MKTFSLLFLFWGCILLTSNAQSEDTKKLLADIDSLWEKNADGNPVFTYQLRIVRFDSSEVCKRISNFLKTTYANEPAAITVSDIEKGSFEVKTISKEFYNYQAVKDEYFKVNYKLNLNVKGDTTTLKIELVEFIGETRVPVNNQTLTAKYLLKEIYPLTNSGLNKNKTGQVFYYSWQFFNNWYKQLESKLIL